MNISTPTIVQTIKDAAVIYTLSVYFVILIGGVIGNICNTIVFKSLKLFHRNQCAFYLVVVSVADILLLIIILPFRIGQNAFDYDPTRLSLAWCKIRNALVQAFSLMSFSVVCFAAIDQYFSMHYKPWLRQLSSLKLAHRLVCTAIAVWSLQGMAFLIFFEIQPTAGCDIYNKGFQRYYSFVHFCVFSGILPIISSGTSAILAYFNVRRIVRRQVRVHRRRLDRQLTAMVLSRVAFLVVTTSPFVAFRIYLGYTKNHLIRQGPLNAVIRTLVYPKYLMNRSIDSTNFVGIAIEQLITALITSLFYMNSAGTFYVFLSVSKRFRQQVKRALVKNIWRKLLLILRINDTIHHPNQVVPVSDGADLDPVD